MVIIRARAILEILDLGKRKPFRQQLFGQINRWLNRFNFFQFLFPCLTRSRKPGFRLLQILNKTQIR